MAELVANTKTSLQGEEVIVRAVLFFTSGKWRTQSQSARIATFVGRPPIPFWMLILTVIAFCFFVLPGVILYLRVIRRMRKLQNIVVTVNPISGGSDVVVKYIKHATKQVNGFLQSLPPMS